MRIGEKWGQTKEMRRGSITRLTSAVSSCVHPVATTEKATAKTPPERTLVLTGHTRIVIRDIELVQVLAHHHPVVLLKITTHMALILIIQVLCFVVAEISAVERNHLGDTGTIHHPMLELVVVLMGLNLLLKAMAWAGTTTITQKSSQEMEIGTV